MALVSASVDFRVLTLTYNQALDEGSKPDPGDFLVSAAGNAVSVSSVDVSGSTVVLTLASAVGEGERVRMNYTADATKPIRRADGTGGPAESFSGQAVSNVTDARPSLLGASLVPADRTKLRLNFDQALDESSAPGISAFTVRVNGASATVGGAVVSGSRVTLTLGTTVASDATVTVSYDRSLAGQGGTPIRDLQGGETASFSDVTVRTNNRAPTYSGSNPGQINSPSLTLVSLSFRQDEVQRPRRRRADVLAERGTARTRSAPQGSPKTPALGASSTGPRTTCELANLEPLLTPRGSGSDPVFVATLTATDPYGESASIKGRYLLTNYFNDDGVPCARSSSPPCWTGRR